MTLKKIKVFLHIDFYVDNVIQGLESQHWNHGDGYQSRIKNLLHLLFAPNAKNMQKALFHYYGCVCTTLTKKASVNYFYELIEWYFDAVILSQYIFEVNKQRRQRGIRSAIQVRNHVVSAHVFILISLFLLIT